MSDVRQQDKADLVLVTREELRRNVGDEAVRLAEAGIDCDTVQQFHLDARGRIEAAICPASQSREKPSYVRVTRRGSRFFIDCHEHGKNHWCLHAIILVLHHLGYRVSESTAQNAKTPLKTDRRMGFRLIGTFFQGEARFQLRSQTTGRMVQTPLRYLSANSSAIPGSQGLCDILEQVASLDEDPTALTVTRDDLAPVLRLLGPKSLHTPEDEAWTWVQSKTDAPRVNVALTRKELAFELHWNEDVRATDVIAPGRPGYRVTGNTVIRYADYLPDFQALLKYGPGRHRVRPDAEFVWVFLKEKHRIQWDTSKPWVIRHFDQVELRFTHEGQRLRGTLGVVEQNRFFPLGDSLATSRLLWSGRQPALLRVHSADAARLEAGMKSLRVPWEGGRFSLNRADAVRFLQSARIPDQWNADRRSADAWFGLTRLEARSIWDDFGQPSYRIGGDTFEHQTLIGGLLDNGSGVRLPSGRTLRFDTTELRINESLLTGVRALHRCPDAQKRTLSRILGRSIAEDDEGLIDQSIASRLRPYQRQGVKWLIALHRRGEPALLADDMGLGKTVQTLAYLDAVRRQAPQLVVMPRSLLSNWLRECQRFSPQRQVSVHHGATRTRSPEELADCDLILTSYGTLRADIDILRQVRFQVVVLDEAQAIKNPRAQIAQAAGNLTAEHGLCLTGTPIENRLLELWSIFEFLAPSFLGHQDEIKGVHHASSPIFQAVKTKVRPFILRREKKSVERDLPQKQEIVVRLPLNEEQAELYETIRKRAYQSLNQHKGSGNTLSILTQLLRLRQVCCHPGLVDDTRLNQGSVKFEYVVDRLAGLVAAGHAVLVFSQFTSLLKLLQFELETHDLAYLYLDGSTRNRMAVVDRFQNGAEPIFLISLKAGGTGLNLTRASYVFHLDPWWNPMVEMQATDRTHRIGQQQVVMSYKLITEQTVEEKILQLQETKRSLARGLFSDENKLLKHLTRDDLLGLFT